MKPPFDTTPMIIYPEGLMENVYPKEGKYFSLEELQTVVGGYIERVQVVVFEDGRATHLEMYVNETGKLDNLPWNAMATLIYHNNRLTTDEIRGTVLVTPPKFIARDEEEDCA